MAQFEGVPLAGKARDSMKIYLQSSHDVLVSALYNIDPLLDQMIASQLLTHENYYEIRTEKIPPQKARKLLEIVQLQMNEKDVRLFIECLGRCKHHYPRLKAWLAGDTGIIRGPTEQKLQKQANVVCQRLGHLVIPIAMRLFSNEMISQYELDIVQGETTLYCQAQRLINICLQKGERSCQKLYEALHEEDTILAEDINGEAVLNEREPTFPIQLQQDTEYPPLLSSLVPTPQEETQPVSFLLQDLKLECGFDKEIQLQQKEKELVREALTLLQLDAGRGMSVNVCEFGLLLGLPRKVVQDCLFELESAEDFHQLAAVIHIFMEKTNDEERLRQKMASAKRYRLFLSRRAALLLKLLQSGLDDCHHGEESTRHFSSICLFILRDCLAEVEEDASEVSTLDVMGCLQRLQRNGRVDVTILKELAELWTEGTVETFCRSIPFTAQLVRDLFPFVDSLEFDAVPVRSGVYRCHPRAVKRITSFKGLPARIILKVIQPKSILPVNEERINCGNRELLAGEFTQICLKTADILQRLQDYQSNEVISKHGRCLDKQNVAKELRRILATEDFGCSSFDSGVKARLLSLVEFDPFLCNKPLFLSLHSDTLISLAEYLKTNETHCFQFIFEEVHMYQCNASFYGVRSVRDPVAIDEGIEQVFQFSTSDRASFLIQLQCRGYRDGQYLQCNRPLLYKLSNLPGSLQQDAEKAGTVVANLAGTTWLRDHPDGGLKEVVERIVPSCGGTVEIGSCCFLINSWNTECEIRFRYKGDTITAKAERNADTH
ncbi:uncharacterized protein LOC119969304 isoform X1 [Scyliorhinus canicula]|uniref:uncharacterized protein LOC119969304 isoform X1 n=1 Tax=Scyliorhinus canicula TaxID=7830 RepID=UPI0018F37D25|nr:uncharacterized protein LOC119969304 isoform X1 [Scyliorhinus canicula]XP_038658683.1 uncharacterized protein LOC119969304 isoform X1 [Scyliorhinus canicula]